MMNYEVIIEWIMNFFEILDFSVNIDWILNWIQQFLIGIVTSARVGMEC